MPRLCADLKERRLVVEDRCEGEGERDGGEGRRGRRGEGKGEEERGEEGIKGLGKRIRRTNACAVRGIDRQASRHTSIETGSKK